MGPLKILLVDDDDLDVDLFLRALGSAHVLHKTTRVRDGVEALEFVFREGAYAGREPVLPDLIVLDMHMPRAGGLDVLQTLKSDESTKKVPILVLSSSTEQERKADTHLLGSVAYLNKPLNASAFLDVVKRAGLAWQIVKP